MDYEPKERLGQGIWGRRTRRGKLLVIAIVTLLVALGLGLGLGLGFGLNKDDNDEKSPSVSSPIPSTPPGTVWQPAVNASWQIVLLKAVNIPETATSVTPDVDIWDLDLFLTPKTTIDTLHRLGKKVICYFSAGSFEPDRPDSNQFRASDQGRELKGWPGEKWLNLNSKNVRGVIEKRLELAAQKGCDAVDPDNTDAYDNNNGIGMSQVDSINFLKWMITKTHSLKMAIGLKNSAAILQTVLPGMQFSVQEQCVQFNECKKYTPFIQASKPVFHIEYPSVVKADFVANFCKDTGPGEGSYNFSTAIKNMNLDGWLQQCNGATTTTPT